MWWGNQTETSFRNLRSDKDLILGNGTEAMEMDTDTIIISEVEFLKWS